MEEYKQWLEQQIERCLNDKDLQREHWAFCKAYEKFAALRQPLVSGRSEQFYCVSSNALVYGKPCEKWCGDENCKALCKQ